MSNEAPMRESLLGLEPLNPRMQERFEQQIQDIYDGKLTKGVRLYYRLSQIAVLIGATGFAFGLLAGPHDKGFWLSLLALAVMIPCSVFYAKVLARGRVDTRVQLAIGKFMPALGWLVVTASFVYGVSDPARRPDATFYGIYALALFVLVSSINLWNRIVAADYHAQEHSLRLEYRLAELASHLPPSASAAGKSDPIR
jgi:hypothetical protein